MVLRAKRIRKIKPYLRLIPPGNDVWIGVVNPPSEALEKIGFSTNAEPGESILPSPNGPVSRFNAEGKEIVHEDRPMETAYRTVEWHWTEWHGPRRVEQSDFRDIPYQRYPRTFVVPPALELTLVTDSEGNSVIRTPKIINWKQNEDGLVHAVNLLLEIFGECVFYDAGMKQLIEIPIKRLNWEVLPPGQRPWTQLKQDVKKLLDQVSVGNRPVVEHRLETINEYEPNFAAVGQAGFRGYVILGFKDHDTYVLESLFYGNATYVFGERWEELSKRTKAEILGDNLQKARFMHRLGWDKKIKELLGPFRRKSPPGKGGQPSKKVA